MYAAAISGMRRHLILYDHILLEALLAERLKTTKVLFWRGKRTANG